MSVSKTQYLLLPVKQSRNLQRKAPVSVCSHSLQRTYWPSKLQLIIPSSCSFTGISLLNRSRLPSLNLLFADTTGIIATEIIKVGKKRFQREEMQRSVTQSMARQTGTRLRDKRANEIYQC